ncbi:unnamed protein product [Tetraodon nigroviridis]|uniref:(spotted green pufferfish) hypothetical protein n=1 Tax=Tetraodon nigroviridis TaxID=99883 RepID=Q4T5B6_TETNG|nr:unnamed protein product [Tetraodon nigroviridis]
MASSEVSQKHAQMEEKKQQPEEIKNLQAALMQSQNLVSRLEDLFQEKSKEVKKVVKKEQMRNLAHVDMMCELSAAQAALEESAKKREALEKHQQAQLEENLQLHRRKLEEMEERLRRELADETEKLRKELSDREEAFKKDLSEKENAFRNTLQGLSEQWEARAEEWAKKEEELQKQLQDMKAEKMEAPLFNTENTQKKRRRIWRFWRWKIWRCFRCRLS